MKHTVSFKTRQQAEAFRARIKQVAPMAYSSAYLLRNRYAVTVSGDISAEIIERCRKA